MLKKLLAAAVAASLISVSAVRAEEQNRSGSQAPSGSQTQAQSSGGQFNLADWQDKPVGRMLSSHLLALMKLRNDVNLTDDQKQKIETILKGHKDAIAHEAHVLWQKRNALRDAVLARETDEQKIRTAADDLGKALGDSMVKAARLKGEVAKVLNDQQKEQIRDFLQSSDKAMETFFTEIGGSDAGRTGSRPTTTR